MTRRRCRSGYCNPDAIEIATNFTVGEWKGLKLTESHSPDWQTAITVLKNRLLSRYFMPVETLLKSGTDGTHAGDASHGSGFGFAIMAINCLLVETIQAFKDGVTLGRGESTDKADAGITLRSPKGKTGLVQKFLTSSKHFKSSFTTKRAQVFYKHFRCGILHAGQTMGTSLIWDDGPLVVDNGHNGIIINRNEFSTCLRADFDEYLQILSGGGKAQDVTKRRNNLKKVMDHICGINQSKQRPVQRHLRRPELS